MAPDDDVLFARVNRTGEEIAELRADLPVWVLAVFDAMATSEHRSSGVYTSRTSVITKYLTQIAQNEVDKASLVLSLARKQSDGTGENRD